jgi:hypothetical protein
MIDHALTQMNSEDDKDDGVSSSADHGGVGGSCYHIRIGRAAPPNPQIKTVTCQRLDSRRRPHHVQNDLPTPILNQFKTNGRNGKVFELRTEARIGGALCRAHPNYRGKGPWCDHANVEFELGTLPDHEVFVNDHQNHPAKLVAFYRLLPDAGFQVLAHCGGF